MNAVSDEAVEAAARANIHPQSDPSDIERRKMRRALEAAMPHLAATLLASQEAEIGRLHIKYATETEINELRAEEIAELRERVVELVRELKACIHSDANERVAALEGALTEARDRFNLIRRAIYADEMQGLAKQGAVDATTALRPAETGDGQ